MVWCMYIKRKENKMEIGKTWNHKEGNHTKDYIIELIEKFVDTNGLKAHFGKDIEGIVSVNFACTEESE